MTFEPRDGGTELTLRHTGVPDDKEGRDHEAGWTWVLDEFARRITERRK